MSLLNFLFKNKYRDQIKRIGASEFKAIIKSKNVQLIDVRTPSEFRTNKIKGARNINYHSRDFLIEIDKLNKNNPVLVYCKSGFRSGRSAKKLAKLGFTKVYDLKGGILKWD